MPNESWFYGPGVYEGETALRDISLRAGRIINVNTEEHTYDVVSDNGEYFYSIPLMYPYVSNEFGQGINILPEFGTRCLVANTVNGEDFIMGFLIPSGTARLTKSDREGVNESGSTPESGNFTPVDQKNANSYVGRSGNRTKSLLPGDIEMKTVSGNVLRMLVGGTIEITGAEGQCFSFYNPLPGENEIFSRSDIFVLASPSGSMRWKTDINTNTSRAEVSFSSDGSDESDVRLVLGQPANDVGEPDLNNTNKLTISLGPSNAPTVEITADADGNVKINNSSTLTIETDDKIEVNCKSAEINSDGPVTIKGSKIDLN